MKKLAFISIFSLSTVVNAQNLFDYCESPSDQQINTTTDSNLIISKIANYFNGTNDTNKSISVNQKPSRTTRSSIVSSELDAPKTRTGRFGGYDTFAEYKQAKINERSSTSAFSNVGLGDIVGAIVPAVGAYYGAEAVNRTQASFESDQISETMEKPNHDDCSEELSGWRERCGAF